MEGIMKPDEKNDDNENDGKMKAVGNENAKLKYDILCIENQSVKRTNETWRNDEWRKEMKNDIVNIFFNKRWPMMAKVMMRRLEKKIDNENY